MRDTGAGATLPRCGLTNPNPIRDVMSERARFRHGYSMASLSLSDREDANQDVPDAMKDEGVHVDEAVLNLDVEEWLATLDDRRRKVATALASGYNTGGRGHSGA